MLHIVICDDDVAVIELLEKEIKEYTGDKVYIVNYNNLFALETYICEETKNTVDAIYVSLDMDKNCIDTVKNIQREHRSIKIIFMSKEDSMVRKIFGVDPMFYLHKPLDTSYVKASIQKLIHQRENEIANASILYSQKNGRMLSVQCKDIIYFESNLRKVIIETKNGPISFYGKLNEVEAKLPSTFLRIHQSYIVNMDEISVLSGSNITLSNGLSIAISRSKYNQVVERLGQYLDI